MKKLILILVLCLALAGCKGKTLSKSNGGYAPIILGGIMLKKGTCPFCGSEERAIYHSDISLISGELVAVGSADKFIQIENFNFYVCANCGNVYAVKEKESK